MQLIENYQPSQPHGWPGDPNQPPGATISGHAPTANFTVNGRSYRMSVRPLAYAATPSAEFTDVLHTAFGRHYSFRYASFTGRGERVPSQVDNMGRANPFYSFGGLTSMAKPSSCGRLTNGTLTICGGVTWGWQVA